MITIFTRHDCRQFPRITKHLDHVMPFIFQCIYPDTLYIRNMGRMNGVKMMFLGKQKLRFPDYFPDLKEAMVLNSIFFF